MYDALYKQKEQALKDLAALENERQRAINDDEYDKVLKATPNRIPRRQVIVKVPNIDIKKYERLPKK